MINYLSVLNVKFHKNTTFVLEKDFMSITGSSGFEKYWESQYKDKNCEFSLFLAISCLKA